MVPVGCECTIWIRLGLPAFRRCCFVFSTDHDIISHGGRNNGSVQRTPRTHSRWRSKLKSLSNHPIQTRSWSESGTGSGSCPAPSSRRTSRPTKGKSRSTTTCSRGEDGAVRAPGKLLDAHWRTGNRPRVVTVDGQHEDFRGGIFSFPNFRPQHQTIAREAGQADLPENFLCPR